MQPGVKVSAYQLAIVVSVWFSDLHVTKYTNRNCNSKVMAHLARQLWSSCCYHLWFFRKGQYKYLQDRLSFFCG